MQTLVTINNLEINISIGLRSVLIGDFPDPSILLAHLFSYVINKDLHYGRDDAQ